ncbi:hypothetical protein BE08_15250 [Sorangium cellulosum]|uniref:Uncharacterized protein n=1 Tax=Sorangium cellulosum TaxID=56 RepID=A0A150P2L8_SORCE|nr:hypothetical protein BE08_15250 [Sorangium cellulosum]
MTDISEAARRLGLRGVVEALDEVDAPAGSRCYTGRLRRLPDIAVSLVEEGAQGSFDVDFIDAACTDVEPHLRAAAAFVGGAGRAADWVGWGPELTFFSGREWTVRFAVAPGAGELGALVTFDGVHVTGVDDLADADFVD